MTQPVRSVIKVDVAAATGFLGLMPALTPDGLGLKSGHVLSIKCRSAESRRTWQRFSLSIPQTGTPLAMMDGRLITEMSTAAVSAVATKLLAAPDAKILAILGSGVQARSHVEALRLVRQFEEIRVWSPTSKHAERFAEEVGATVNVSRRSSARRR